MLGSTVALRLDSFDSWILDWQYSCAANFFIVATRGTAAKEFYVPHVTSHCSLLSLGLFRLADDRGMMGSDTAAIVLCMIQKLFQNGGLFRRICEKNLRKKKFRNKS